MVHKIVSTASSTQIIVFTTSKDWLNSGCRCITKSLYIYLYFFTKQFVSKTSASTHMHMIATTCNLRFTLTSSSEREKRGEQLGRKWWDSGATDSPQVFLHLIRQGKSSFPTSERDDVLVSCDCCAWSFSCWEPPVCLEEFAVSSWFGQHFSMSLQTIDHNIFGLRAGRFRCQLLISHPIPYMPCCYTCWYS